LAFNIIYLIFTWGQKEYRVMSNTSFTVFNTLLIICITFSIILIFLSILYGILLVVALLQYLILVPIFDSCAIGITIGMVFGYYGLWYYIALSCAFCGERSHLLNIGYADKPGPDAKYDINGNPIIHTQQVIQPVIIGGQYMQQQMPQMVPIQQQPMNNIQYSNPNVMGNGYMVNSGITYQRVGNTNNDYYNNNIQNPNLNFNNNQRTITNKKLDGVEVEDSDPNKGVELNSKSKI